MTINAGDLKHYIEMQEQSDVRSSAGGLTNQWTKLFNHWAQIRPVRGREAYIADQVVSDLSHVIIMRYTEDSSTITVKNRIIFNNRIFSIQNIINVEEQNVELRFYCVEVQLG